LKSHSLILRALLRFAALAVAVLGGLLAFHASAVSAASGHTGQALALRVLLHPGKDANAFLAQAPRFRRLPNGRILLPGKGLVTKGSKPHAVGGAPTLINEGVQTFDVFSPPPTFQTQSPAGPLTPTNMHPVWSSDEKYIVFSSNLDINGTGVAADRHFHIFAASASGGQVVQITSGPGNEDFPALNVGNTALAFTSDAQSPGVQNLYAIGGQTGVPFQYGSAAVNVSTLTSASNQKTVNNPEFGNVQRSTWSPGSDVLAFSATALGTNTGHVPGVNHIYFLNVANNGYQSQPPPNTPNPPAALTDGSGNDTDPAWSPDGRYIAFASTATAIGSSGRQISATTSPTTTSGGTIGGLRGIYLLNGGTAAAFGVPAYSANGGRVTVPGTDDFAPAWSANTQNQYFNPNGTLEYLAFARGTAQNANHDIYYFRLIDFASGSPAPVTPETTGGSNDGVLLNTDDNAGQQGAGSQANAFDDTYPTWAPFSSVFSIAYQSPRSVTYDAPGTNTPLETALSLPQGSGPVGVNYSGILESQVLNLDPPTLLRYNGNQVIRVQDADGSETRSIQPSVAGSASVVTFTVRLSNREAGIDDNKVFLQIKDPDSKYQDTQGLEHKVFAGLNEGPDSGTARFELPNKGGFEGFNLINSKRFFQFGAVGGADGPDTISVGHGLTLDTYKPWGPEYECQFLNPTVANPNANPGDYGTPYYLAGVDDQLAFSGLANPPRPTTNTTTTDPITGAMTTTTAEYLPLTRLPDAQQDGQGGILYQTKYATPISPSDFYLDVIAYDKAQFPAIQAFPTGNNNPVRSDYHGDKFNWRIYDNVGGFTTSTFDGSNDILVVSDNALGQKFAATTFGGSNNGANLLPIFYGAESYFTDIDVSLLPNAVDFTGTNPAPTPPPVPRPDPTQSAPTQLSATPGTTQVTLEWAGTVSPTGTPPTAYNIYRSTTPGVIPGSPGVTLVATVPGTQQTSYVDRGLTNGTTYYYVVTAVNGTGASANETGPSNEVPATPQDFTAGPTHIAKLLSSDRNSGASRFQPNVLNGLGVGSYVDSTIDDRGRVSAQGANMPFNNDGQGRPQVVPFVRSQKYSIWRILSRGAIPQSVLAAYQPTFQAQPAVADITNNFTAPAAPNVPVANRCVIWISPYTGDLPLVDAGSLENPTTQSTLQSFVNSGGRFFLSGQDVANALTLGGSTANSFVANVLNAKFGSDAGGTTSLAGSNGPISGDASFNGQVSAAFQALQGDGTYAQTTPGAGALLLSNDQGDIRPSPPNWRADASEDQIGPGFVKFGGATALGRIDTISPINGAATDITTGGQPGLIYSPNFTSPLNQGFGSRVVFASFGLEGIGIEYYKVVINSVPFYVPRNQRPNLLHNIVNYLRTGTFTGRITQASGQGVANATVYLTANGGTIPGPRQTFSATTAFDGSYTISGLETGIYKLFAYKSGFTTAKSNVAFSVEGDNTNSASLVIAPTPPGRIQGTVTDTGKNPIAGAAITFVSSDKQITLTAVSSPTGTYTIDNVPAGAYTGLASKQPQFTDAAPVQADPTTGFITVPSGGTAPADFVLTPQPATLTGIVFADTNGDGTLDNGEIGVAGASVSLVPTTAGAAAPPAATTGADGSYTVTNIGPGTYTLTVSAAGFATNASQTLTIAAGDKQTRNVPLIVVVPPPNGTLGGLVQTTFGNATLGGATVTITDSKGTVVQTATTSDTPVAPGAPAGDGQPLNYGPVPLPAGVYTVTVTDNGYGTQTQISQTVASGAFTRVDFTQANGQALAPIHAFGAGLNFFSVPYNYGAAGVGFDALLGSLNSGTVGAPSAGSNRSHIYVYDPTQLQYVLDPTPPADALRLGQGYWVYLLASHAVTTAAPLAGTPTIAVGLKFGWNMIGVPSVNAIQVSGVSGLHFANAAGGGGLDFATATSSTYRLVSGTLYGYNGSSYVPVTAGGTLQPYQAYWIYAYVNTTVLIPTQ